MVLWGVCGAASPIPVTLQLWPATLVNVTPGFGKEGIKMKIAEGKLDKAREITTWLLHGYRHFRSLPRLEKDLSMKRG